MIEHKTSKIAFLTKVEILDNGRLIVDGGDGNGARSNGGGAGGIIQIISQVGNLSPGSLSLGHGKHTLGGLPLCNQATNEAHGYYYLQGMPIKQLVMRVDNFHISSRPFQVPQSLAIFIHILKIIQR